MNKRTQSRRRFMKSVAAAGAFSALSARSANAAPSERIGVGIIGLGGRGMPLLRSFMSEPDVRIAALCDVHPLHYRDNPWGKGFTYGNEAAKNLIEREFKDANPHADLDLIHDYRKLCAREDIDAVVVATPDHWHALCIMEALKHGKDVYCEKPVTHTFYEGMKICEAVKAKGTVFQVGSQQRSERPFRHGAELVRNGVLGKVSRVEVGLPAGYESHRCGAKRNSGSA